LAARRYYDQPNLMKQGQSALAFLEIVELPWGTKLVPVDELARAAAPGSAAISTKATAAGDSGRPRALAPELVRHILAERAAGKSFARVAGDLNASGTPTAHGGRRWWPSTVRSVLLRSS
jgi:hypothetical protein